ncbi:hypothetical protein PVL29_011658 [Vitis rotundifolia]|uniref:Phytocyanin domain-containing protein n=1 Tax=Vitis rotundifolia TaxID=103349 RepID=A0AA39DPW7_VITRO|nr:hypothetical protein PVL29_011658 [Vitis rotundifolia]
MARLMSMAVIVAVLAAMLHYSAAQTAHVVGDNTGWTVPQGGASTYTSWASGKQFVVGDTLVFNFATNAHDVAELSKESFDACDFSSTIGNIITTGPANITLATAGNHYYVCTIGSHCTSGQKLAISVSATPGASPPSSSTAPPPPSTTNTPSPTGEVCPPTTAPSPNMSNTPPTTATSPSTTPGGDSSSSTVFASVFVSLVSLVISFFL